MLGLVRTPIDLGLAVAKTGINAGLAVVRAAYGLIEGDSQPSGWDYAPRPAAAPPARPSTDPTPAPGATAGTEPPAAATPPPPAHVSEEPVPVAEFAEPGAEDGAGAELDIDPPWEGYDSEDARAIVQRLRDAGQAAAAAVELYEAAHKGRRDVIDAAHRRLRELSVPSATPNR